ncbi:hypothetical protein CKL83_28415 [Bacillus anthracis]|uniref:Uncharacterized protein n=4 Tax=Bacillus thuringiensis TaxID=1428 RepID=A0A437SDZ3_BACTU|nr:hypothetical protein B7P25_27070 [Bacillus thuringiensis]ASE30134.1 hypothetical protein CEQ19_14415 [Bacillus anthracis]KAA0751850.1 hypothetical protein DN397_10635 [Bacillus sp. AY1-10]KAA2398154.1 hypothetical protein F2Y18_12390 [Bacillus cereus]KAB7639933.1 hypothetical protein GBN83_11750 [Bacillus sp. B3-WWTP-C-10-D-3]MDR4321562.1 hypothetical protein [Bacillus paranthracis]OTW45380.1 hypothetical protein BK699_27195 [Bacillus thuringiensis serovar mexicanensis]OTW94504.1 hypothet
MGEYRTSNYGQENYVFFILAFFAPKSTKPDRERVEMNERNLEITISKCAFHCIRSFSRMVEDISYYTHKL